MHPDVLVQDAFIKRRYEDLSLCIHKDIKNGRGQYNYYAPWLEIKLQPFPAHYRETHSVLQDHTPQVLGAPQTSTNTFTIANPSSIECAASSSSVPTRSAWSQEDNKVENRLSTFININRTLPPLVKPTLTHEEREQMLPGNIKGVAALISEDESKSVDHSSSKMAVQCVSFHDKPADEARRTTSCREVVSEEGTNETVATLKQNNSSKICTIL